MFDEVIAPRSGPGLPGASTNTGRAVVQLGSRFGVNLQLPENADLATLEGLRLLNERLRSIEIELERIASYEVSPPMKLAYGSRNALDGSWRPVDGAKVSLDKIGTWLILVSCEFEITGTATAAAVAVVDPASNDSAMAQNARAQASITGVSTAWALYTTVAIPKLVQIYAKRESGAGTVNALEAGSSLSAIWLAPWKAGDKRFGRQAANAYGYLNGFDGQPLTNYGEESRYPAADHPDTLPLGASTLTL